MIQYVCGHCDKPLKDGLEEPFCSHCGTRLLEEEPNTHETQHVQKEKECVSQIPSIKIASVQNQEHNASENESSEYPIEDLHSFALRIRERIVKVFGNARRGFRSVSDGMDSGSVTRERLIESVRSTWGFAAMPRELIEATVDKYLTRSNGSMTFDKFSQFIISGPEPLDLCCDDQTALSSLLLPMQDAFLRKHSTPQAAFLSIHSHVQGVVTIDEIRKHVAQYLRVTSLTNVEEETFKDVIRRASNIEGNELTYHDFSRMLSYPYVGQQQWRRPSTSPQRVQNDNHPSRRYY